MTAARRAPVVPLALGALLALASSGHAFIRLTNDGTGLSFRSLPISYAIHASGSDDVRDDGDVAAVRLAFDAWTRAEGASLSFRENAAAASGVKVHANDGVNMVLFDESNATGLFTSASYVIAITPVFYDAAGGILDSDVVFNGRDHTFGTDLAASKYDIQNIATHEIGHFIGLDHSGVAGATLMPFAYPGESRLRSLAADDRAGAATAYPGAATASYGSLAGQIVRDSTSRGVNGAHVVAVNTATGEPESSALTSASGTFSIESLRPATYRVYAEPLDGPCMDQNIQRDGIETGFATLFYGGIASPLEVTIQPGQRNVQLGQLRVRDVSGFNLDGALPRQVLRGATVRVDLSGQGIVQGLEVEVAGSGVRLGSDLPQNHGRLTLGSSFTCSVDANATPGLRDIYVFRGSGASREVVALPGGFEVIAAAPAVTGLTPASGVATGGEVVTVRGANFRSGARVLFGAQIAAQATLEADGTLRATTPANQVGAVAVTVINPDGQQARLEGAFSYVGPPTLAEVAPGRGPSAGGVPVALRGDQFSSAAQVLFDGKAATNVTVSEQGTRIDCVCPSGAPGTLADVSVTNPGAGGGTSLKSDSYAYIDPQIASIDPPVGAASGGTIVQILGDGFGRSPRVDFGARSATAVQWVSQTELRATAPAGTAGSAVDIAVLNGDGRIDVLDAAYRYVQGVEPRIASSTPDRGTTEGGDIVRIFGSGFEAQATVLFGGRAALAVGWISTGELRATAPRSSTPGPVDLVVRNPNGLQAKAFGAYTYDNPTYASRIRAGGGGGGCAAVRPSTGSGRAGEATGEAAGALAPLLTLAAGLAILRRRVRRVALVPVPALASPWGAAPPTPPE